MNPGITLHLEAVSPKTNSPEYVYVYLYSFVASSNFLYPYRYGFRAYMSICIPPVNIQAKTTQAFENNEYSIDIFLDLAMAFDSVDHKMPS